MKDQELSNFLRKLGKREIPILERSQFHLEDTDQETGRTPHRDFGNPVI
jgi:hypothetical protein